MRPEPRATYRRLPRRKLPDVEEIGCTPAVRKQALHGTCAIWTSRVDEPKELDLRPHGPCERGREDKGRPARTGGKDHAALAQRKELFDSLRSVLERAGALRSRSTARGHQHAMLSEYKAMLKIEEHLLHWLLGVARKPSVMDVANTRILGF